MADVRTYLTKFEERRKKRQRYIRRAVIIGGVVVAVGGIGWFVLRAPLFRVKTINVFGNVRASTESIIQTAEREAVRSSLFARLAGADNLLIWPRTLSSAALQTLPNVRTLRIEKSYRTREVLITVSERKPTAVWCLRKQSPVACYWFDEEGTLFEPAPEFEGSLVPVVSDYVNDDLVLGAQALSDRYFPNLLSILTALRQTTIAVREIRYENAALGEVRIPTFDGPMLFMSLRFSASELATALEALKAQSGRGELKPPFRDLQYIDLRIKNRVYYQ